MRHRTLSPVVTVCVAAVLTIAATASSLQAFTQITGTFIRVTQVKPLTEKGAKSDAKIPPDVLRYLKSKLGSKYNAYGLEVQDGREAKLGIPQEFVLVNKGLLTFRVTGYDPASGRIYLSVKTDDDAGIVTIQSGNHLLYIYPSDDKDQPPLIVVVLVKLLAVER